MREIGIRLGGPDRVSIKLLEGWPNGLYYRPDVELGDYTAELIDKHFAQGSSVFHDGDKYEIYYVQRVRNYAHIRTLIQAEIWEARVVATLPSPCEVHEGRVVSTTDAASWVKWFKTLDLETYAERVFGKDYGFPPFGIECCCRLEGIIPGIE